jgi:hypothetical protein
MLPRLRDRLTARPADRPGSFALLDPYRVAPAPLVLSAAAVRACRLLDGTRSVSEVAGAVGAAAADVGRLVEALDAGLFLEGPALDAVLNADERPPCCVGVYPDDPAGCRELLNGLFTATGGPGSPGPVRTDLPPVRAVLAPHMDYARGGVTYGWAFKEWAERTTANLVVVAATSHYSGERFTLTRQHFRTPLGVCETDRRAIDLLANEYGPGVFADRLAHFPEHSIELEVLFLQRLRPGCRVVPLLCGSFADRVHAGTATSDDLHRMAAALRTLEAHAGEPVSYLISGDLAHIGPKFRDPVPLDDARLAHSRGQDDRLLRQLEAADPAGYFGEIAAEGDERNVCGLPPTWLALTAARPSAGRVLHYQQYVHPTRHESVSFAAAAFDA